MEHYVSTVGSASVFRYRRAPYVVEVTGHYRTLNLIRHALDTKCCPGVEIGNGY